MNKIAILTAALSALAVMGAFGLGPEEALKRVAWYGQDALRIELGGKLIWVDPVGVKADEKADIILVTHSHGDHYSAADIKKLTGPNTVALAGFDASGLARIKAGESRDLGGVSVAAVPAYNIVKTGAHPKANGWVGFLIKAEGLTIYVAGDTERIPEMAAIDCDIAFIPLGQTYTMGSVAEAVQAALDVKAKMAVPVHYGMYEGTAKDADDFVAALAAKGVKATRLERR
jgi:L-ascorbate metabolism protein UlaG (beta-lactamase superfamily)